MPTLCCAAYSSTNKAWFGYFEGESDGYMFKAVEPTKINGEVQKLLKEEPDLSVRAITSGQGQWFVHMQHMESPPDGREFVMFKSYDAFNEGVNSRVQEGRKLTRIHCDDAGLWAAYFEGQINGKCNVSVADKTEDMLKTLDEQVSANEMSLECITYGDGAWFMFFLSEPTHNQGDANWSVNSKYEGEGSFSAAVTQHTENDSAMRCVAYGAGKWFGYWEGVVPETSGWAWHTQPKLQGFVDKIKAEWEADDENAEGADTEVVREATEPTSSEVQGKPPSRSEEGQEAPPRSEEGQEARDFADLLKEKIGAQELPQPLPETDARKVDASWRKKLEKYSETYTKSVKSGKLTDKLKEKLLDTAAKEWNKISSKAAQLSAKFAKAEEKRAAKEAKKDAKNKK